MVPQLHASDIHTLEMNCDAANNPVPVALPECCAVGRDGESEVVSTEDSDLDEEVEVFEDESSAADLTSEEYWDDGLGEAVMEDCYEDYYDLDELEESGEEASVAESQVDRDECDDFVDDGDDAIVNEHNEDSDDNGDSGDDFLKNGTVDDVAEYSFSEDVEHDSELVQQSTVKLSVHDASGDKLRESYASENPMPTPYTSQQQRPRSPELTTDGGDVECSTMSGDLGSQQNDVETVTLRTSTSEAGEEEPQGMDSSSVPSLAMYSMWDRENQNGNHNSEIEDEDDGQDDDYEEEETGTMMSTVADLSTVVTNPPNHRTSAVASSSQSIRVYRLQDDTGEERQLLEVTGEEEVDLDGSESNNSKDSGVRSTETKLQKQQELQKKRRRFLIQSLAASISFLVLILLAILGAVVFVVFWDPSSRQQQFTPSSSATTGERYVESLVLAGMANLSVAAAAATAASFEDESSSQSIVARHLEKNAASEGVIERFVVGVFLQQVGLLEEVLDEFLEEDDICLVGVEKSWSTCEDGVITALRFENYNSVPATVPAEVILLRELRKMELEGNRLTGTLSPVVGSTLTRLATLEIRENELTGAVTPMPYLKVLDIRDNQFTSLPESGLPVITEFVGHGNQLSGRFVPSWFGPDLASLDVSSNFLEGTIPSSLCTKWPLLKTLNLGRNSFIGTVPADLYYLCRYLNFVDLQGNSLSGPALPAIPTQSSILARATGPKQLSLSDNNLTGSLDAMHTLFPRLQSVWLSRNALTGRLPTDLPETLRDVFLDGNALTGTLSPIHFSLPNLLNLSNNQLTGTLPSLQEDRETHLMTLDLSNNLFRGRLPHALVPAPLHLLRNVNVSHNELTGPLPPPSLSGGKELWRMKPLFLDASWNHFTGTIPSEFGEATEFRKLLFHHNKRLSGTIPTSFVNLRLEELNIEETNITGNVSFLCRNDIVIKVDCEKVECLCCSGCMQRPQY